MKPWAKDSRWQVIKCKSKKFAFNLEKCWEIVSIIGISWGTTQGQQLIMKEFLIQSRPLRIPGQVCKIWKAEVVFLIKGQLSQVVTQSGQFCVTDRRVRVTMNLHHSIFWHLHRLFYLIILICLFLLMCKCKPRISLKGKKTQCYKIFRFIQ